MTNNYVIFRQQQCIEAEDSDFRVSHERTTNNRQCATVSITMPNGQLMMRHNISMPENKMIDTWRA
eukprot:11513510-Karenia_brevis.AAC.1